MSSKKNTLWILAAIFGILAVVLYLVSIVKLDRETARYVGVSAVANIQATVFSAACAVLCGVNVAAALIAGALEENAGNSSLPSTGALAGEVANAIRQNEIQEKKKQAAEAQAAEEDAKKQQLIRERIAEQKRKSGSDELSEIDVFLAEMEDSASMLEIWKKWQNSGLSDLYPDIDQYILKLKETERMYGKNRTIDDKKKKIREMFAG